MGSSEAVGPHTEAGDRQAEAIPKARANYPGRWWMWGSHLSQPPRWEDSLLNCAVPGTSSRTGETPPYGISGGAAGDVTMGAGLRASPKGMELPPDPTVCAPVPHPTARRQSADSTEGNMPNTSRFIRMSTGLGRTATGTLV